MPVMTVPATIADLEALPWRTIFKSDLKNCREYVDQLYDLMVEAETSGKVATRDSIRLLLYVCLLRLQPSNYKTPLKETDPNIPLEDLGEFDLSLLRVIKDEISDCELRARVQDVLFVRTRDWQSGAKAVGSYVESAKRMNLTDSFDAVDRLERAVNLSHKLNNKEHVAEIQQVAADIILATHPDPNFVIVRFSQLLLLSKWNKTVIAAEAMIRHAEGAKVSRNGEGNRIAQRRFLELASEWYRRAGDDKNSLAMSIQRAESFVEEAKCQAMIPNIAFGPPAHLVEQAVEAYRQIANQKARIEELLKLLESYQGKFVQQMIPFSEKLNVDNIAGLVKEHAKRPTIPEAILALCHVAQSPSMKGLFDDVKRDGNKYIGPLLFGQVMLSSTGKTTAVQPPLPKQIEDLSPPVLAEMFRRACLRRSIAVAGMIEPARQQIVEDHGMRRDELAEFVFASPIVPNGRQQIILEGLLAGFDGEFLISTHLLIPQVEHLIRTLLNDHGHRTTSYDENRIQNEQDLNTTLRHPELSIILGEDLVFDLRGLLIERFGSNLRNEMAHGMRWYGQFFSAETAYCWWITLKMVCTLRRSKASVQNEEAQLS